MDKFFTTFEIKADKEEDRTVEFVGSREIVDRDGDVIKVDGIKTENYERNPVVLWGHDRYSPPIGKTISIKKTKKEIRMKVQFATMEEYSFADTIYRLAKGGYVNAVSIGFAPNFDKIEYPRENGKKDGPYRIFNEIDLLELSVVPVPANQSALVTGKALQDGVIDEVELKEYEIFCKNLETTKPKEEEIETIEPVEEINEVDELKKRIEELENKLNSFTIKEVKEDKKSYIDELYDEFKSATGTSDDEPDGEANDEDELYDELLEDLKN